MGKSYLDELKSSIKDTRKKVEDKDNKKNEDLKNTSSSSNKKNSDMKSNQDKSTNSKDQKTKHTDKSKVDLKDLAQKQKSKDTKKDLTQKQKSKDTKKDLDQLETLSNHFSNKASDKTKEKKDKDQKEDLTKKEDTKQKIQKEKNSKKEINLNLQEKDIKEDQEFKKHIENSFKKDASSSFSSKELKNKKEKEEDEKDWEGRAHLVTEYDSVKVYRVDDELLLHYKVPTPKPTSSQKLIINTLKEAATRLISTDPYKIRDPLQRKNVYYQKIMDILDNAPEINIPKHMHDFYAKAVVKEMVGYGILEPLLKDEKLEEIMVVGPNKPTYVYHVDFGMMTTNILFTTNDQIYEIIDKISRTLGRRVDKSNPLLDARLPDGSRVNATVPPASIDGDTLTIRKFKKDPYTIVDLVNFGTLNLEVAAFLWSIVEGFGGAKPANLVISGGTSSGKTTTLNILANFIPESQRILTIEDTAELRLPIKHVIRFEGKPPGLEGRGELSLDILVKNTLRMRPDRIIVGEIRHKEALSLFTAMNTGHDGCMGTIHSNSARETLVRITSPPMNVPMLMMAGLDFILVQKRLKTNKGMVRRIVSIAEVTGVLDNEPKANIIFKWNPETDDLERTKEPIQYFDIIKSYTKLDENGIKNILEKKIKFLKTLVDKDIRQLGKVSNKIQNKYIDNRKK